MCLNKWQDTKLTISWMSIDPKDQHKIAFATTWGVFAYRKMPFGYVSTINEYNLLRIWLEIFLDDLCVYSWWLEHLKYLRIVFDKCKLYRISLNPLNCQFWVKHGVILGHVVSKNRISTNYGKIKMILELPPPTNFKGIQRFTGHTSYYRLFIYMYADIAHPLYKLLIEFKWTEECHKEYDALKKALARGSILRTEACTSVFELLQGYIRFVIATRRP